MRVDKFLKVSRIIKRRTVANTACDGGRVSINGKSVKPSHEVKVGDIIEVSFGTGKVSDEALARAVRQVFDLRPTAIIRDLDLRRPIYRKLAAYGHMGREDLGVAWEKTDRAEALKKAVAL